MAKVAVRDEHRLGVFLMIASALVFALSGVLTE
jgi:hypothetical protein